MFRIRVAMVYSTGFVLMPDLVREETSEISKEGMWDFFGFSPTIRLFSFHLILWSHIGSGRPPNAKSEDS